MPDPTATVKDLGTLAELIAEHPELSPAVKELHLVLALADPRTPLGVLRLVLDAGGHIVESDARDHTFEVESATLPAGAIELRVHKMRPNGPMLPQRKPSPRPAADGPVRFDEPELLRRITAQRDALLDDVEQLFEAANPAEYSKARTALEHHYREARRQR